MTWLFDLWRDVGYAVRVLRRNPTFASVAIATLALTLGANTAMFGLVHKVLIAYLPVHDPERLALLSRSNLEQSGLTRFPDAFFRELETETNIFDGVLGREAGSERVTLGTDAGGEPANGELVSGSYFEVLGVKPYLGRLLTRSDDLTPGAHPVVVLSHRYWQRRFGGDRTVVGRTLRLTGYPMTVIGVSPPGFDGLEPGETADLRVPLAMKGEVRRGAASPADRRAAAMPGAGGGSNLIVVGRLRRDVSAQQAEQVLTARLRRYLDETTAASNESRRLVASERLHLAPAATGLGMTRRQYDTSLRVLMAATASVLVIACLNLANLLLVRSSVRAHEFATRLAIGAGSGRLVRQLLTEGLVLSSCGAVFGAILAYPASALLIRLVSGVGTARALTVEPNPSVVAFHVVTAVLSASLFGLTPALAARRQRLTQPLQRAAAGGSPVVIRRLFLSGQVALSVVVLVGALLFVRTIYALRATDLGFRADRVLVLALSPKNAGRSDGEVLPFFRAVRDRVKELPGVTGASYGQVRPLLNAYWRTEVVVAGCCPQGISRAFRDVVGPEYFATMGIPLVEGRDFTVDDNTTASKVAIVNETFARQYGAGRSLLGARIGVSTAEYTIVGISKDSKYAHVRDAPPPLWYVPYEQHPNVKYLDLYVHTDGDPQRLTESVRAAIASVGKDVALFEVRTLEAQLDALLIVERMVSTLALFFGSTAAALAALGVYGILAFIVTTQRRETAIRMALGARPAIIVRQVIGEAYGAVGFGIVTGVATAAALTRYTGSLLYGVTALDPVSFAGSTFFIASLALLAASMPARRAACENPSTVLREP